MARDVRSTSGAQDTSIGARWSCTRTPYRIASGRSTSRRAGPPSRWTSRRSGTRRGRARDRARGASRGADGDADDADEASSMTASESDWSDAELREADCRGRQRKPRAPRRVRDGRGHVSRARAARRRELPRRRGHGGRAPPPRELTESGAGSPRRPRRLRRHPRPLAPLPGRARAGRGGAQIRTRRAQVPGHRRRGRSRARHRFRRLLRRRRVRIFPPRQSSEP